MSGLCKDDIEKKKKIIIEKVKTFNKYEQLEIFKIIKKKKLNSNIFNVGAGKPYKVRDVIKKIINITKKGRPVFGGIPMRKDEINEMFPSVKKVKKFFKWNANIDLTKGLKHTINFYEKKNF